MPGANDNLSLAALRERFGERYRWRVLFTVMIGNMAAVMAATTINVAVPAISQRFGLAPQQAQWLATGFMAAMTLSMLCTAWLLARFGYRQTCFAMLALLGVGGTVGGLANSIELVLAMRVVEGLAGGVLQTIPGVVIMHAFARHEQGRAMGLFGMGTVLAPAIGPSVGGVLIEWFGWRAIFFFVLPFCVLAAELARRCLPHSAPGGLVVDRSAQRPDGLSLLLLLAVLAALLNGMVELQGPRPELGIALLLAALASGALFVWRQRRTAAPLLQLSLFAQPVFSAASVVGVVYGAALFGSTYLVPLFMIAALGLAPSTVGAVLLPAGLALAVTIPLAGRLADRQPVYLAIIGGLALMATSFAVMVGVGVGTAVGWLVVWVVMGRVGLGFVMPSLSLGAMRGVPSLLISAGAGTMNFLRQIGGVVGINLVGILLAWRLQAYQADAAAGRLRAYHEVFMLMAALTLVAAAAAWRMRPSAMPRPPLPPSPP